MTRKKRSKQNAKLIQQNTLQNREAIQVNQYAGFNPYARAYKRQKLEDRERLDIENQIPEVELESLDAQTFWTDHISARKPAILRHASDTVIHTPESWTLDFLDGKAGSSKVSVERQQGREGFGKGVKEKIQFSQFLQKLKEGSENFYLTTQEEDAENGQQAILAPPALQLKGEFEIAPKIMGNLVLETINLWLGSSSAGSSSGLHHDFHDNLYVLLHGCKSFCLWSPSEAEQMYTHGRIIKVYPNGRIIYEGQEDVQADGSLENSVLDKSQNEHEQDSRDVDLDSEEELEAALNMEMGCKKRSRSKEVRAHDDFDALEKTSQESDKRDGGEPLSFSKIDLSKDPESLEALYPQFPGLKRALRVSLEAGDMLYLPAGWFHEVTSSNDLQGRGRKQQNNAHRQNPTNVKWHMALNYWFHPPDNLNAGMKGHKNPYKSNFWPVSARKGSNELMH